MNQSKFSFADLFTVLATVVFGFFCYLSFNFFSLGETIPSIIKATIYAVILGGFAFGAKLLKRTSKNFKTCIIWEWVLLFFFVMTALLNMVPFSHYFAVSEQKNEIREKVTANITQAENMFADYENYANNRLKIYEGKLRSIAAGKKVNPGEYAGYGFVAGTDDNTQIENKMYTLEAKLLPSNYKDMEQIATEWLASSKADVTNWSPTGIVTVINTVESEITSWRNELNGFSAFRAQGETANDFDLALTFDDVTDKMTELGDPTSLSLFYAIGLYVLMLLSWYITKRHYRYPGLKMIFGTGGIKDNEL